MSKHILLYGATGYTGQLIAQTATAAGLSPILAGRTASKIAPIAQKFGLPYRAFGLENNAEIQQALEGTAVILNCAGPFQRTAPAFIQACLQSGTHYLDLAGEVPEFEAVRLHDTAAQQAGIMLMPGAGFGVVPTDCLALHLKNRLPAASQLVLAYETVGGVSQGTAQTVLKNLHQPGFVRRDGRLIPAKPAEKSLRVDFGHGKQTAVSNPWRADLTSAAHTTGIATIETYAVFPAPVRWIMQSPFLRRLWGRPAWQKGLDWLINRLPAGPSEKELRNGRTTIWGQATAPNGQTATLWLHGPEAYLFTAQTAVALLQRILSGQTQPGWQTPARVYGADFINAIPHIQIHS